MSSDKTPGASNPYTATASANPAYDDENAYIELTNDLLFHMVFTKNAAALRAMSFR